MGVGLQNDLQLQSKSLSTRATAFSKSPWQQENRIQKIYSDLSDLPDFSEKQSSFSLERRK